MNPLLAFTLHLPLGYTDHGTLLVIIFCFVLLLILMKLFARHKRDQLWHETVRLALEKGQPLPADLEKLAPGDCSRRGAGRFGRHDPWSHLRRGLIQLAVGAALYFALSDESRVWALIPAFIGVANLVMWLIFALRADKSDDRRDPPTQA